VGGGLRNVSSSDSIPGGSDKRQLVDGLVNAREPSTSSEDSACRCHPDRNLPSLPRSPRKLVAHGPCCGSFGVGASRRIRGVRLSLWGYQRRGAQTHRRTVVLRKLATLEVFRGGLSRAPQRAVRPRRPRPRGGASRPDRRSTLLAQPSLLSPLVSATRQTHAVNATGRSNICKNSRPKETTD
jgi:hypothetical protein